MGKQMYYPGLNCTAQGVKRSGCKSSGWFLDRGFIG